MRFWGDFRHWFFSIRAVRREAGVAAGFYVQTQPTLTYLNDSGVRKLVVRVGGDTDPVQVEIVVPDAAEFLASVREGEHWVRTGNESVTA